MDMDNWNCFQVDTSALLDSKYLVWFKPRRLREPMRSFDFLNTVSHVLEQRYRVVTGYPVADHTLAWSRGAEVQSAIQRSLLHHLSQTDKVFATLFLTDYRIAACQTRDDRCESHSTYHKNIFAKRTSEAMILFCRNFGRSSFCNHMCLKVCLESVHVIIVCILIYHFHT